MTAIPSLAAAAAHPVAFMVYATSGRYQAPRHIRWIGERVMRLLADPEQLGLVVSCPPRHGKTVFLAEHLPPWFLGTHPDRRVIYVTMQERFSRAQSKKARNAFYRHAETLWGVSNIKNASTAEWEVYREGSPTGGSLVAVGSGGTLTGKGADLIVIDDLIRNLKEAENENLRESSWEWFQSAVLTRLEPGGKIIILMTRWNADDLIGRLESLHAVGELGGKWEFVNLPAIAEDDDALGRRPGEPLWPERFPTRALEKKQKDVGPQIWASLYQGRPSPKGGRYFKEEWFRRYRRMGDTLHFPDGSAEVSTFHKFATIDLAASKKRRADYTVIAIWGFHPTQKILVLLDLVRDRMEGHEIVPRLKMLTRAHGLSALYAEREGPILEKQLGGSVLKDAVREGLPVVELEPQGDKEARAIASQGTFAAGLVWFPLRADWFELLKEELLLFPAAKHDDQVDAVTYAVQIFREAVGVLEPKDEPADEKPERPPDDFFNPPDVFGDKGDAGGWWSSGPRS